jgi:hypothetical protein
VTVEASAIPACTAPFDRASETISAATDAIVSANEIAK